MKKLLIAFAVSFWAIGQAYAGSTTVPITAGTGTNVAVTTDGSSNVYWRNTLWDYSAGANGLSITTNHGALIEGEGTAGTGVGGVLSIQGVASGTAVPVSGTFWPYSLGQQLAASSVPVVLTAAQLSTLTPLTSVAVTNTGTFAVQATLNSTPTLANGNGVVPTQGGTVLSATNGWYGNLLQGNAVLSATNPIFFQWSDGTNLAGAIANYGTSPGAVKVPGVNAYITGSAGLSFTSNPAINFGAGSAWSSATSLNATQTIYASNFPPAWASILVQLNQTTTITGGAVTFQQSFDGTNWVSIPVSNLINPSTGAQLTNPYTFIASTNQPFLLVPTGATQYRLLLSTVITGSGSVTPQTTETANVVAPTVYQPNAANLNATVAGTGTFPVQATLQASATTAIGKVDPNTIATWGLVALGGATGPTNAQAVAGEYLSSSPTYTTGQSGALQMTAAGSLHTTVDNTNANGAAAASASSPVTPSNQPIGAANFSPAQVSVTSSATSIAAARTGVSGTGRVSLTVTNTTTTAIYLGGSGVTTSTGTLLPGIVGASVTINTTAAVYGIVATGSATVTEFETY